MRQAMELAAQTDPSVHRELSRILAEAIADSAAAAADAADDAEDAAAADEAAATAEAAASDPAAKEPSADASFAGMQSREIRNMKVCVVQGNSWHTIIQEVDESWCHQ